MTRICESALVIDDAKLRWQVALSRRKQGFESPRERHPD